MRQDLYLQSNFIDNDTIQLNERKDSGKGTCKVQLHNANLETADPKLLTCSTALLTFPPNISQNPSIYSSVLDEHSAQLNSPNTKSCIVTASAVGRCERMIAERCR
jgi:hypothetical protein